MAKIQPMKILNLLLLIYILLSNFNVVFNDDEYLYKCGIYEDDMKPKIAIGEPFNEEEKIKRRLDVDEDEFKEFKIYFDPTNIKNEVKTYHVEQNLDIYLNSVQKAIDTLQKLIKVKPLQHKYYLTGNTMKPEEIKDFDTTMFGDGTESFIFNDLGYDLIIFGRLYSPLNSNTLASAGAYKIENDGRPFTGRLNINYNVDYSKEKSQEYLESILIHEFTHVLGFSNFFFTNYFNNVFWKVDNYGVNRTYINSSKVIEVGKKYYNCDNIEGIALEEYGGSGTVGSHWEARILLGDYMNGYTYTEEQVISEFTLALLEDSGYYKVNYYTGGLMRYGKHKGCAFLYTECVDKTTHTINPFFENEFYDSINSDSLKDASCSSGRQSRTYYAWWLYPSLSTEYSYYVYFNNTQYGGFSAADFCPVAMKNSQEETTAYYTGQCSKKGNGEYGTWIYYLDNTNYKWVNYTSEELQTYIGETFSDNSFCFLSSSFKEDNEYSDSLSEVPRALCYNIYCSEKSLTVQINDDYIVCPRAGGKINIQGYKGYFLCPDYNLMCSGTVICNDMFDCVDKKSELKESSYIYDYEIKTSQNTEDAEINESDDINNYELSKDGICPINCKQCKENKICNKCKNDYGLIGTKENEKIECIEETKLQKGYYKNDKNIYYKCIPNCDTCVNDNSCNKCSDGFEYSNNKCFLKIENCNEYNEEGICNKCNDNYAFEKDNRNECKNKEQFSNNKYYTLDNGISYYPCNEGIENCLKCNYNQENSNLECNLCINNYVLINSENICYKKDDITLYKIYYLIDDTHAKKCSQEISNCNQCENQDKCIKCVQDYYLLNDDIKTCYNKLSISLDEYYLNEEGTTYYSCEDSKYNSINNCKSCLNKDSCSLCQDDYTFIDGDKTLCVQKSRLEQGKYIQDKNDISNYIKCSNFINNCDLCNDDYCTECNEGFIFVDDNHKECVDENSDNYINSISLMFIFILCVFVYI